MNDDELMSHVRAVFDTLDPPPGRLVTQGLAALRHRLPGALLAELTDETGALPAGVRGGSERLLTFTGPGLSIEIEVTGAGPRRELAGRLDPPGPASVRLRHPAGDETTEADPTGQFVLPGAPAGLISLVLTLPDATTIVTSWTRI